MVFLLSKWWPFKPTLPPELEKLPALAKQFVEETLQQVLIGGITIGALGASVFWLIVIAILLARARQQP